MDECRLLLELELELERECTLALAFALARTPESRESINASDELIELRLDEDGEYELEQASVHSNSMSSSCSAAGSVLVADDAVVAVQDLPLLCETGVEGADSESLLALWLLPRLRGGGCKRWCRLCLSLGSWLLHPTVGWPH